MEQRRVGPLGLWACLHYASLVAPAVGQVVADSLGADTSLVVPVVGKVVPVVASWAVCNLEVEPSAVVVWVVLL